ncbi:hypothetical protein KY332_00715 [Candidatus Woesearchaeota archaeon]|nr:hypothetical protein [Candidatus Woesearchaeota archaeon]
MQDAYKLIGKFNDLCEEIREKDISNLSNAELKDLFSPYMDYVLKILAYVQTVMQEEIIVTEKLKNILNKKIKDEKEFQDYFLLFTSPSKIGFFEQENQKLLALLKKIKQDSSLTDSLVKGEITEELGKLLDNHLEEFSWLGNMGYEGKFWGREDIAVRLKDMIGDDIDLRIKEVNEIREKREEEVKEAAKKLNLSDDEILLIEGIRELVYFRSFRLDIIFRSEYIVKNLFEEIAKRMGMGYTEMFQLFYQEIIDFLDGKELNKELIEKRKMDYAFSCINREIKVLYGEDIKKLESEVGEEEVSEAEEIKGSVASQGKVQGVVKLVYTVSDLPKVKEGDILVASMTKPDYIIAMEKAAAFVTDEGGITCHAAIVSREMNKPCIIGTKIATKVLKDGDLVEVDAKKGIVKVLKRK